MADAVDQGVVTRNVTALAKAPKAGKSVMNHLRFGLPNSSTPSSTMRKADWVYPLGHLAAMTGMRRGSCSAALGRP